MNAPVRSWLDKVLVKMGSDSTLLGSASIGLAKAPFVPSPTLTLAGITEANFTGYGRKSIGTPSVPFTGGTDGLEYVEGVTVQFLPSDTVTPNTIYGAFLTSGSDSATLIISDLFAAPIPLNGPSNQLTITPRVGLDPAANFGFNVISS